MNWETLLSFGDSITFGARSYLSYPEICCDILSNKMNKSWHIVNHATNGFTTIDLCRSINPQLNNYKVLFPSIITVMIGTNDIKMNVNLEEFRIAYQQLIVKLKLLSVNNNIIVIKIPRITTNVFYPYNFSMNKKIIEFNGCIEELCKENSLRYIEFNFLDDDYYDGVHLNPKGCRTSGYQLANLILKDKGIETSSDMS